MSETKANDLAFDADNSSLNKREYFAAMAMQGLNSCSKVDPNIGGLEYLANLAVKQADYLISALNKEQTNER